MDRQLYIQPRFLLLEICLVIEYGCIEAVLSSGWSTGLNPGDLGSVSVSAPVYRVTLDKALPRSAH